MRVMQAQESRAALNNASIKKQLEAEEESEEEDQLDEEELEAIRKQSMAGLFMSFSMAKKEDADKKKKPPLPPRDGISEDSMEDMVSDFDVDGYSQGGQGPAQQKKKVAQTGGHSKNFSIDTDTILRNANLNDSMASEGKGGKNGLPLP